ncbi:hypothetical protein RRG08_008076 [Elysia crispata]|uniref:Uncharacterized protein n=1 Tax=Elysia crispata TaxID=231223 RepID=A0AAE0Y0E0_9GAST|nr:hypothetical protein RRG08_008076 [Elysia crispata]
MEDDDSETYRPEIGDKVLLRQHPLGRNKIQDKFSEQTYQLAELPASAGGPAVITPCGDSTDKRRVTFRELRPLRRSSVPSPLSSPPYFDSSLPKTISDVLSQITFSLFEGWSLHEENGEQRGLADLALHISLVRKQETAEGAKFQDRQGREYKLEMSDGSYETSSVGI